MTEKRKKFRFVLIPTFKQQKLQSLSQYEHLLEDVDWTFYEGADRKWDYLEKFYKTDSSWWPVENREEFALATVAKLPMVREACESGKFDAIILMGGGMPGFFESVEIARPYGIPVTATAYSQMHIASMLGNKFSVIDVAEPHAMYYHNLTVQLGFAQKCASIRSVNEVHVKPGYSDPEFDGHQEQEKAKRGERSEMVERAVEQAVAAIQEDGAEVITFGCSSAFWLQPYVEKRLHDMGWEVPVLEGYSSAIVLAKLQAELRVTQSGLKFPGPRPKQRTMRKIF